MIRLAPLRHCRQFPAFTIIMLDKFVCKLLCIHGICPCLIECRMTVMNRKAVLNAGLDCFVLADIGKAHVLAVPLQCLIQSLETDCQNSHYYHFIERSCLREI